MLKIAWADNYAHPLPEGHRFPMAKYVLLPEQLLYEGTVTKDNFFVPEPIDEKWILTTHHVGYWNRLKTLSLSKQEERRTGFPLSKDLVEREMTIANGTLMAAKYALEHGISMNIAGGTHHAYTNRGEGFCLLNDQAIAANFLLNTGLCKKILIIDLDVHQGNGTAEIFAGEERVFTLSVHAEHNYPLKKEVSDLDIGLPDNTEDKQYLQIINHTLPKLMDQIRPDFVLFQSGVDVLKTDKLGRLSLSIGACKERDKIVLELCKKNNIPIVISMGGGYSERIAHIIEAHANTYRLAREIYF